MADNNGFTKFVARNKIGQGKGGKPAPQDTKRKTKPLAKGKVGPVAKASVGWPGEGGQRNGRADAIRNLRNMRRQGGRFGSGEGGVIGPYSPRIDSGKPGKGPYGRKDPRRIV